MPQCVSIEALRAFLSNRMSSEESAIIEEHLTKCSRCQDLMAIETDDSSFHREFIAPRFGAGHGHTGHRDKPINDISTSVDDATVSPSPPTDSQVIGRRYQLGRRVGIGSVGEVWAATDLELKRTVAVKIVRSDRRIPKKFVKGFLEEGQKLAQFQHSGIVQVYDVGESGDRAFIVTEYLTGGSLSKRMESKTFSPREAASLVAKVARAAHAAHSAGFVHCDIKPSNIILDGSDNPRLSDFGLAIAVAESTKGAMCYGGTLPYMSREQSLNQPVDFRTDVYSIGVVLYELLTDQVPHRGASEEETRFLIQNQTPNPPRTIKPAVPNELNSICLKCLEKGPENRFSSAAALADALEDWLSRRPKRALLGYAAAIFTAILFIIVVSMPPRPSTSKNPPNDSRQHAEPVITRIAEVPTRVVTMPDNARIVVYPLDDRFGLADGTGRIEFQDRSPASMPLAPGTYLVVVALDDGRFHEVYRTIPRSVTTVPSTYPHLAGDPMGNVFVPPPIVIPDNSQIETGKFSGAEEFEIGSPGVDLIPAHVRRIPAFELATHESTFGDYRRLKKRDPPSKEDDPSDPDEMPLYGIWWDDAVSFAESAGMRLPSEAEYEFAATNGGVQRYPWGDDVTKITGWPFGLPGQPEFDMVEAGAKVYGLYSNVAEWTSSLATPYPPSPAVAQEPRNYIVRGGPRSVVFGTPKPQEFLQGPRRRLAVHAKALDHMIGVRLARSAKPRLDAKDLEQIQFPVGDPSNSRKNIPKSQEIPDRNEN